MRRWQKVLLGVGVVVAVSAVWIFWPESAADEVAGIAPEPGAYDATILRDDYGVPHIFGKTDADVAYGLAWAHSEDDFLTIQLTLLAGRGRLASVMGPDAAPVDYVVSLLRIPDTVEQGWPTIPEEVRDVLDAYADGLNHYAATHPDEALVGLFPVTGKDLVAAFVQKVPLFFGLDEVIGDLFGDERPDLTASVSPAARYGSNVFAVSPRRSATGETMLVSNSHQPWTGPVAWYEASVHSEQGWDMTGALFPGMPFLALGHNRDLAWSFTVNRPDLIDVYLLDVDPDDPNRYRVDGEWKTFEVRTAEIEVRLVGRLRWTFEREALWSVFGPVIRRPHGTYAVRYAGMGTVGLAEQLYRMNKATSFEEWRDALSARNGLPSFNVGYADRTGRIAYIYHGLFPDRDPRFDWDGYLPGDTTATLWTSYLPLSALPQVVDPESGYIQSSNSTPYTAAGPDDSPRPGDFPATMGIETHETNRSLRSRTLLAADPSITFDELVAIKFDVVYDETSAPVRLRDRILGLGLEGTSADIDRALETIARWDRSADRADRATALIVVTLAELLAADVDINPSQLAEPIDVSDGELAAAFTAAVETLVDRFGRVDPPWGDVNRLVRGDRDLPLDGGPDLLRAVYGRLVDGRFEGIAGDAYVLVVSFRPDGTVTSRSVHQFGSATLRPDSAHYADQADLFARNELKPVWFDEADVRAHLEAEYRPGE